MRDTRCPFCHHPQLDLNSISCLLCERHYGVEDETVKARIAWAKKGAIISEYTFRCVRCERQIYHQRGVTDYCRNALAKHSLEDVQQLGTQTRVKFGPLCCDCVKTLGLDDEMVTLS